MATRRKAAGGIKFTVAQYGVSGGAKAEVTAATARDAAIAHVGNGSTILNGVYKPFNGPRLLTSINGKPDAEIFTVVTGDSVSQCLTVRPVAAE